MSDSALEYFFLLASHPDRTESRLAEIAEYCAIIFSKASIETAETAVRRVLKQICFTPRRNKNVKLFQSWWKDELESYESHSVAAVRALAVRYCESLRRVQAIMCSMLGDGTS